MGINTLGALLPGNAYYVLVSDAVEVSFGECMKGAIENLPDFTGPGRGQNLEGLTPWEITRPTSSSHSFAIMPIAIKGFDPDSYREESIIGAFNQAGQCFGAAMLNAETLCLTMFGDDPTSTAKDGFEQGEQIIIKLFKPSTNEEFYLTPEFDLSLPDADGTFVENGLSAITGFSVGVGVETHGHASIPKPNHISIYPNPTTSTFQIMGIDADALIEILDMQGQLVQSVINKTEQGNEVDLSGRQPGIYITRILSNGKYSYKKLVLR